MISTIIKIPQKGEWPDDADVAVCAVHLYAHYSIVGLPPDDPNIYFGREYLLAESKGGVVWSCYGDSKAIRSMSGKARQAFGASSKSYDKALAALLKKGYRVVGELNSAGKWCSQYFSYPATWDVRGEAIGDVPLSVRYPLSSKVKEAFKDTKAADWF